MATDLTGTPTSLGIGTYNVDADAPSGLGFNAAMAQIDAIIAARISNTPSLGDAMVYNGTAWVKSSSLTAQRINVGGSSQPKITTSAVSGGPPASPQDGDIWVATGVDANGTRWAFQYNAGSASAFKWEFFGGPPIRATDGTIRTTTSTVFVDFGAPSPTLSLARAGDYALMGSIHTTEAGTTATSAFADIAVVCSSGAVDITEAFGEIVANGAAAHATPIVKSRVTGVTPASTAKLQWLQASNAGSTTANGDRAWIEALPVRVS